jgi:hypothetical protein
VQHLFDEDLTATCPRCGATFQSGQWSRPGSNAVPFTPVSFTVNPQGK